jgi:general secretion pathway protein B
MSILLDALKKSEELRQLGKAPSIHSPVAEPGDGRPGAPHWIPLALMAVSAIVLAWIGWQQFRVPPESAVPGIAAGVQAELPAAEAEPGDRQDAGLAASRPPESLRTPVENFRPETKAPRTVAVIPSDAGDDGQPGGQTDSPAATGIDARADDPDADERVAEAALAAQDAPAPGAEEAPSGQPGVAPHVPEPISYWELPQGIRDSLPEMRVSVLVYAERPQDRFVLVSGQRMVEKDEFEGGVVLEEIRRDGAVFQYRNYRFLMKS